MRSKVIDKSHTRTTRDTFAIEFPNQPIEIVAYAVYAQSHIPEAAPKKGSTSHFNAFPK